MRALIIEDDRKIAQFVARGLAEQDFGIEQCDTGEKALELLSRESFDVAILDLMLPDIDGLIVLKKLRAERPNPPVLVLSAKRSVDNRVECLAAGADDYMTKPFAFAELLARIQALLRRSSKEKGPSTIVIGDLTLDLRRFRALRGDVAIDLQPREFALLEYLMRHVNQAVYKKHILEHVWGYQFDPQTNVVDVLMWRLRNKVDRGFEKQMLKTIKGVGYVLTNS